MTEFAVVPATEDVDFDDIAAVFGERGDASRCFCQFFCYQRDGFRENRRHNMEALRNQLTWATGIPRRRTCRLGAGRAGR